MEKSKNYHLIKFSPDVISKAYEVLLSIINKKGRSVKTTELSVKFEYESWGYDSEEEFYADCKKDCEKFRFAKYAGENYLDIEYYTALARSTVSVDGENREEIEEIFEVFEKNTDKCKLPEPPKELKSPPTQPQIFIGHGNSEQWRELKDHLQYKYDYDVATYEVGARAGHAIRDILEDMLLKNSFAILVVNEDDRDEEGNLQVRQNVIHELGLFQGKLGYTRALVLLEEGTEEFSNIQGIHQIRYGKKNIKETFGEILATLKRELG
jgi:predicted nucleotide-binding protein